MPRQQVSNINPASLDRSANRVQTFVQGPRAPRTNSLMEFAAEIQGFTKDMSVQVQRDNLEKEQEAQRVAADNKIYGSNLAARVAIDMNYKWEQSKGNYHTIEEADQWWSQQAVPEQYKALLDSDAHIRAGYADRLNEMKLRALTGFSSDLIDRQTKAQKENFTTWFTNESVSNGPSLAFAGLKDYAKIQKISPKDLNESVLDSVDQLAKNKQYELAEQVLTHERTPQAGSLVSNTKDPDAHRRANDLLVSVQSANQKERFYKVREDKEFYDQKIKSGTFDAQDLHDIEQKIGSIKGYMTKAEYGKYVDAAVRKEQSDVNFAKLDDNFNAGRFYDPITGNTEEDDLIRKSYLSKQVDAINADVSLDDNMKFFRKMSLSATSNAPIGEIKNELDSGYSTIIPAYVINKGEVPAATLKGVETYMNMQKNFPNQLNAHVDGKAQDFYEDVSIAVKYLKQTPVEAVRSVIAANDANQGLVSKSVSLTPDDIQSKLNNFKIDKGWWSSDKATIGTQRYAPVLRNLAARYMRNGVSKSDALDAAMERIKQNVVIINGYPVDKGVHTDIPPHIDEISKTVVSKFIKDQKLSDQYDDDDLTLTPDPKRGGYWWISEKGSGALLETITTDKLTAREVSNK